MAKLLSLAEVVAILLAHGFVFVSQKGSHIKYRNAATGRTVICPTAAAKSPAGPSLGTSSGSDLEGRGPSGLLCGRTNRRGSQVWHVKDLLGHENVDTLNHYVRLMIVDLKKTHARCHPREKDKACGPGTAR
jgi:predicted RNA binding protein YcfA (HicA-like mRNA interferase family)